MTAIVIAYFAGFFTIPVGVSAFIIIDWWLTDRESEKGSLHKGPLL